MSHIIWCRKKYSGLKPEAALQQATADDAEDEVDLWKPTGGGAPTSYINGTGDLLLGMWAQKQEPGQHMQHSPSQQQHCIAPETAQLPVATAAAQIHSTQEQKAPDVTFPLAPEPSIASWQYVREMVVEAWQLFRWLRAYMDSDGVCDYADARILHSNITQLLANLLIGEHREAMY